MDYLIDFLSKKLIEAIVVYILIFKIYSDFVNQFYIYIIISNFNNNNNHNDIKRNNAIVVIIITKPTMYKIEK